MPQPTCYPLHDTVRSQAVSSWAQEVYLVLPKSPLPEPVSCCAERFEVGRYE